MRQAGRYLPAYQAVRANHDFLTMCHTPELSAEVTLQPVREFGFDAAIIFSDILLPLEPMGIEVQFAEGKGPRLSPQIRNRQDIERLLDVDFDPATCFLGKALRMVRGELDAGKALIGFAGAPWTMACYAVEGMSSRDYAAIKQMMNSEPEALHALLDKLTTVLISWLRMQLDAGADAFQVFDSWADALAPMDYREFALPYLRRIFEALRPMGKPAILFSKDGGAFAEENGRLPIDVLAVDWRVDLAALRQQQVDFGPVAYQGNLDPLVLLGSREILLQKARRILSENAGTPGYIFNLGHGITPPTPVENVRALVDFVHAFRSGT
jgi:uroporphyrinogen decarboxylase